MATARCGRCGGTREPVGDGYTRGKFAGVKQTVGAMVDRGVFTPEDAFEYLEQAVRDGACPHETVRISRVE